MRMTCENGVTGFPDPPPRQPRLAGSGPCRPHRCTTPAGHRRSARKYASSCRTLPAGLSDAPAPHAFTTDLDPRPRTRIDTPAPSGTGPHVGRDRCRTKRSHGGEQAAARTAHRAETEQGETTRTVTVSRRSMHRRSMHRHPQNRPPSEPATLRTGDSQHRAPSEPGNHRSCLRGSSLHRTSFRRTHPSGTDPQA